MDDIREALRPLAFPAAAAAVLMVVAFMFFSMAGRVIVPAAPADLFVRHVQIDHMDTAEQRFEQHNRPGYTRMRVTLLTSDDFAGVTFRLMGAARFVPVPVPATLELHMTRDPEEAAAVHRRFPNVSTQIDVMGVRYRDETLADAGAHYEAAASTHWRYTILGQGTLLLSLVPVVVTVRRARKVWETL